MFSRFFYQAGSKPYSAKDPSTLVPHAAIAHVPFSSAQDDDESLVTSIAICQLPDLVRSARRSTPFI